MTKLKACEGCPLKFSSDWEDEEYRCFVDEERRVVYRNSIAGKAVRFEDEKKWCTLNKNDVVIRKINGEIIIKQIKK